MRGGAKLSPVHTSRDTFFGPGAGAGRVKTPQKRVAVAKKVGKGVRNFILFFENE